jgi:hypothetical protein
MIRTTTWHQNQEQDGRRRKTSGAGRFLIITYVAFVIAIVKYVSSRQIVNSPNARACHCVVHEKRGFATCDFPKPPNLFHPISVSRRNFDTLGAAGVIFPYGNHSELPLFAFCWAGSVPVPQFRATHPPYDSWQRDREFQGRASHPGMIHILCSTLLIFISKIDLFHLSWGKVMGLTCNTAVIYDRYGRGIH